MNGWEHQFQSRIDKVREKEVKQITNAYHLHAVNETLVYTGMMIKA